MENLIEKIYKRKFNIIMAKILGIGHQDISSSTYIIGDFDIWQDKWLMKAIRHLKPEIKYIEEEAKWFVNHITTKIYGTDLSLTLVKAAQKQFILPEHEKVHCINIEELSYMELNYLVSNTISLDYKRFDYLDSDSINICIDDYKPAVFFKNNEWHTIIESEKICAPIYSHTCFNTSIVIAIINYFYEKEIIETKNKYLLWNYEK